MSTTTFFSGATVTPEGLQFKGNLFSPIDEQCAGCIRIGEVEGRQFCSAYTLPATKWTFGKCNLATHIKKATSAQTKVNPLKASKRAAKGR